MLLPLSNMPMSRPVAPIQAKLVSKIIMSPKSPGEHRNLKIPTGKIRPNDIHFFWGGKDQPAKTYQSVFTISQNRSDHFPETKPCLIAISFSLSVASA